VNFIGPTLSLSPKTSSRSCIGRERACFQHAEIDQLSAIHMKLPRLETPALQNWSCHGCTDCCRGQFVITLSSQEKERIEKQGWTAADGVDPSTMFVEEGHQSRLTHQKDGACVFLDPAGRCRIHAKFGEDAKPLACRLYPLVIHPAGNKLVVGVRFTCPSAAANRGQPLARQSAEIQKLAGLVVPEDYREGAPPPVLEEPVAEWPDFLRFVRWLDTSLSAPEVPVALKLSRALHWLGAVEKARLDQITDEGADEILEALVQSAANKLPDLPESPTPPSRFGRFFLRLSVLEHARIITVKTPGAASRHRWQILRAAWRFARASGNTPALRSGLASVPFAEIEKPFEPLSADAEATLTRFFRVKIQSLHFCGRAFHDWPLIAGFRNLALHYPIIVWLSRWLAVSGGRTNISDADVARAISMADYHDIYPSYLKWRIRLLQQRNDIARLCGWYGG
jgi:lysine-N-methylase